MGNKDPMMTQFKELESVYNLRLPPRIPFIARLDGKSFHSWVHKAGLERPFSRVLANAMSFTMSALIEETNSTIGMTHSDEISLLFLQDKKENSEALFGGKVNKLNSFLASLCSSYFNHWFTNAFSEELYPLAFFDCRVFSIQKEDIEQYFKVRQRDCYRNWVNSWSEEHLGHSAIHDKAIPERLQLLEAKGINIFTEDTLWQRRGIFSFKKDREVVQVWDAPIIGKEEKESLIKERIDDYYKDSLQAASEEPKDQVSLP